MPEHTTVTNPDVQLCQQFFSSANFANSKASAALLRTTPCSAITLSRGKTYTTVSVVHSEAFARLLG